MYPQQNQQMPMAQNLAQPNGNWCERQQKNKPQSNSLAPAIFLMMVGGLHIGWGIYFPGLSLQRWTYNLTTFGGMAMYASFYVGVICGAAYASVAVKRFPKKRIYTAGICMMGIGSILFIAQSNQYYGLIFGRTITGLAFGLGQVTGLVHAGEVAVKYMRGLIIASMEVCVLLSVYIVATWGSIPYDVRENWQLNINEWIGILGLFYLLIASIMLPFLVYESPVYLIQRGQEDSALANMRKLRNESTTTWDTANDFQEWKAMVKEDCETGPGIFRNGNLRPLLLVTLARIVYAVNFNLLSNFMRWGFVATTLMTSEMDWTLTVLTAARVVGAIVFMFFSDVLGRRHLFLVSTVPPGVFYVIFGVILTFSFNKELSIGLFLSYELASGAALAQSCHSYSAEAFPLLKKSSAIAFTLITESTVQIIFIAIGLYGSLSVDSKTIAYMVFYGCGFFMIIVGTFLYTRLPETRGKSLRQCRDEFKRRQTVLIQNPTLYSA